MRRKQDGSVIPKGETGGMTAEIVESINEYNCQSTLLVAFIIAYTYSI